MLGAPAAPVDRLSYPTGIAVHPTQPVLVVANSNFDLANASGAVVAADLSWLLQRLETEESIATPIPNVFTAAALVPSIGGPIKFSGDGKHIYHVARQDNRVMVLDVALRPDGPELSCGGTAHEAVPDCQGGSHMVKVPVNDPFGLAVRRVGTSWQLLVSVLSNGRMFSLTHDPLAAGGGTLVLDWDKDLGGDDRGASLDLLPGSNGGGDMLLATGRSISGSDPARGHMRFLDLDQGQAASVGGLDLRASVGAMDVRGVAVSAKRQRAYLVSKSPDALMEVDVTRSQDGSPDGSVLRSVELGKQASNIALYEPDDGSPSLILTTSYRDGMLVALDMDTLELFGVVRDLGKNPFDITVDNHRGYAFVTIYNDDTVAVIRLPHGGSGKLLKAATLGTHRDDSQTNPSIPTSLNDIPALPFSLPSAP